MGILTPSDYGMVIPYGQWTIWPWHICYNLERNKVAFEHCIHVNATENPSTYHERNCHDDIHIHALHLQTLLDYTNQEVQD